MTNSQQDDDHEYGPEGIPCLFCGKRGHRTHKALWTHMREAHGIASPYHEEDREFLEEQGRRLVESLEKDGSVK